MRPTPHIWRGQERARWHALTKPATSGYDWAASATGGQVRGRWQGTRRRTMDGHEITFALEGERIPLRDFAAAVQDLYSLIAGLSDDVAKEADIRWLVQDLQVGSAVAVFHGQSAKPDGVARVVAAYHVVGRALRTHEPIPYSERVRNAAHSLVKLLGADVTGVRFGTIDDGIHISATSVCGGRAAWGRWRSRRPGADLARAQKAPLHALRYDPPARRGLRDGGGEKGPDARDLGPSGAGRGCRLPKRPHRASGAHRSGLRRADTGWRALWRLPPRTRSGTGTGR